MIDLNALVDLVRFVFRKTFVRAILLFFLIVVISSLFPATRGIYDRVVNRPELILAQYKLSYDTQLGAEWWYQRVAVVENRGTVSADHVFISVATPGGKITRYEVFADQPYNVHASSDTARGYLLVTLANLAPGAKSTLYVWGAQATSTDIPSISFAAVHDSGSASAADQMSSAEQIRSAAGQLRDDFVESLAFVSDSIRSRNLTPLSSGATLPLVIPRVPPFLLATAIALAVLAWAFLGSTRAAFVHGGLAAVVYWLLVDGFVISPNALVLCSIPFLAVSVSRVGIAGMLYYSVGHFIRREQSRITREQSTTTGEQKSVTRVQSSIARLDDDGWWILNLSLLMFTAGLVLATPIPTAFVSPWLIDSISQVTGYLAVGYLGTMISFSVL